MLPVNGGTPYEKDVAVEASVTRGCKKTQQNSAEATLSQVKRFYLLTSARVQ